MHGYRRIEYDVGNLYSVVEGSHDFNLQPKLISDLSVRVLYVSTTQPSTHPTTPMIIKTKANRRMVYSYWSTDDRDSELIFQVACDVEYSSIREWKS